MDTSSPKVSLCSLFFAVITAFFAKNASAQEDLPESQPTPSETANSEPETQELEAEGSERTQQTFEQQFNNLRSPDVPTRVSAIRAMGESGNQEAIVPLIQVLRGDPVPEVRGWCIRALAQFETPEAQDALRTATEEDRDPQVRNLATQLCSSCVSATPPTPVSVEAPTSIVDTEGLQLRTRSRRGSREYTPGYRRMKTGWILFGTTYGLVLLTSIFISPIGIDGSWGGFVPLAGPAIGGMAVLIGASQYGGIDGAAVAGFICGWLGSIVQIAGFSLAISGHVRKKRYEENRERRGRSLVGLAFVPTGPTGGAGLTLAGRF